VLRSGCTVALVRAPSWLAGLLVASVVLAGCGGSSDKAGGRPGAKPTVLTLADPYDAPTEFQAFVDEVRRLSRGSLRIVIKLDWRAPRRTYATATIGDVRPGTADLGVVGTGAFGSAGVKTLRACDAPFLIDSDALEARVIQSPLAGQMLEGLRKRGLVGLGILPGALDRPFGLKRPLLAPADFKGLHVGVEQSPVENATMRALGATPVPLPVALFGGGSLAGVDGVEQPSGNLVTEAYGRNGGYEARNVVFWPLGLVMFVGKRVFSQLAPDQQRVLERALADEVAAELRSLAGHDTTTEPLLCALPGVRFAVADASVLAALRRSVRPVYAALDRDPETRQFIVEIRAVRARLGAKTDTMPRCTPTLPSIGRHTATSPADGAYAVDLAPSDLPASQRLGEQYGSWQLVLDRGQFRLTQASDKADWNADGRFRVSGHQMTWRVRDAGDWGPHSTPDGVPIAPGSTLHFRWRRTRGALALSSTDAAPKLPGLTARPLPRVSDAPGQRPLQNSAPLQGVWVETVTRADALAHGQDPNGIADNIGLFRLTVRGRSCRLDQWAPYAHHVSVGPCQFAGDTLEFDPTRSDNNTAPAPFFWHWSVYHGRLTFRASPGFSFGNFAYHPWRRLAP